MNSLTNNKTLQMNGPGKETDDKQCGVINVHAQVTADPQIEVDGCKCSDTGKESISDTKIEDKSEYADPETIERKTNAKWLAVQQRTTPVVGIGLDSCVMALPHRGLFLIQTTDFFYPLVDDPFIMGKITCANVLSDLYAMGVTDVDGMSMIIGVSQKLSEAERDIVIPLIAKGFRELAMEAGTHITGGQTVVNPWMTIGGVASSVCLQSEYIMPNGAVAGDVLVLTKPIGTQVAVNAHQWLDLPERWQRVSHVVTVDDVQMAYRRAMSSMSRLNRTGARLMHKYGAHGATDVTGFGLLGHARNLAQEQINDVSFVIDDLPIIANMAAIANTLGAGFGLMRGTSAETSGGLLVILSRESAESFCLEIEELDGYPAWIIGRVEEGGGRSARFVDMPRVIEVPSVTTAGQIW